MEYRRLGRTGLKVSEICMGTMELGWSCDEATAFQLLDTFVEAGGNFLDTANVYILRDGVGRKGMSEEIIGRWMKERRNRQQLVVATKLAVRMYDHPNGAGLSRAHIYEAVDDSLRRLQTDHIDLYQAHVFDPDTPIEETLRALDDLVHVGKVRYLGCSNFTAWRLAQALGVSARLGLARFDTLQPVYNLVQRAEFERELMALAIEEKLGVISYAPLARGFLSGKYTRDMATSQFNIREKRVYSQYYTDKYEPILLKVCEIAARYGATPAQVALRWIQSNPVITAPIVGSSKLHHLTGALDCLRFTLSPEDIAALDEVSAWTDDPKPEVREATLSEVRARLGSAPA